mmetsp:Transcript_23209/g.56472  ORF Transcript_23209/g.56472 Transcript_23209/m.56472 type:complete len:250 (-) Transcript_23209:359-1108(-)
MNRSSRNPDCSGLVEALPTCSFAVPDVRASPSRSNGNHLAALSIENIVLQIRDSHFSEQANKRLHRRVSLHVATARDSSTSGWLLGHVAYHILPAAMLIHHFKSFSDSQALDVPRLMGAVIATSQNTHITEHLHRPISKLGQFSQLPGIGRFGRRIPDEAQVPDLAFSIPVYLVEYHRRTVHHDVRILCDHSSNITSLAHESQLSICFIRCKKQRHSQLLQRGRNSIHHHCFNRNSTLALHPHVAVILR